MGWQGTGLLTNGEHDSLWRSVMGSHVPTMDHNLMVLASNVRLYTMLEYLKKSRELGLHTQEEYERDFKKLAEQAGFVYDQKED